MSELEAPTVLHKKCMICNLEIQDDGIFYKHPKHGIVCEYCPQFKDGGIEVVTNE